MPTHKQHDLQREVQLQQKSADQHLAFPWSVKNQARMHLRSGRQPYTSTDDTISYWVEVEVETAMGARLNASGDIELVAPLGLGALFTRTITLNPKNGKVIKIVHFYLIYCFITIFMHLTLSRAP